jgi:outer membrane protein OmpA-like peptidoglycan-associated protein
MRLLALCLLVSTPALAQVTTNDQALDALKPAKPSAPVENEAPAAKKPPHHTIHQPARPARPVAKPAPIPQVPAAPPLNPVIAPPTFTMPAHPRPNPPPVPIKADAPGTVTAIQGGTRITFGPGISSLNQATHDALIAAADQAKMNPALQISVTAWAPGTPDDPSTPRRLSLDRALAARAVLINAGIPSERIRAIAKGMNDIGSAPPDRAEIVKMLPPPPKP